MYEIIYYLYSYYRLQVHQNLDIKKKIDYFKIDRTLKD